MKNIFYKTCLMIILLINSSCYGQNKGVFKLILKEKGLISSGSCVAFIKNDKHIYYLTAGHLYEKKSKNHEIVVNDIKYKLTKIYSVNSKDLNEDIVIVRSQLIDGVSPYPLSKKDLKNNLKVVQVGYPQGQYSYQSVFINDVRPTGFTTGLPMPNSGASGGAVLLDNEIVGIIAGRDAKRSRGVHLRSSLVKSFKIE